MTRNKFPGLFRYSAGWPARRCLGIVSAVLVQSLFGAGIVAAQGGSADSSGAVIRDPRGTAQTVKVAIGRQVIIETTAKFDRVEATNADIVRLDPMTEHKLLITGQQYGITQVIVWTDDGEQHAFEVNVELDLELLNRTIKDIDPQADAKALSVLGNVLLVGSVSGADIARQIEELATIFVPARTGEIKVQNMLRVAGEQQVFLKCVVAEVSRTSVRRLGFDGFLAGETFRDGFLINQIGGFNPINIQPTAGASATLNPGFVFGDIPVLRDSTLTLGFPRANLSLFIQAMADNQLARILAEPTLVAISGETAEFLVGGEFPVPIPQGGSASGAITIEFKEFGVRLSFTPLVLPGQRVRLTVQPEISARDEVRGLTTASGFVPAITTRRVTTTVEMETGSTIAIAGLLQDDVRGVASKVPGLGNVPILGPLFRSVDYLRQRTELIILVTPEIAAPMSPEQVPELPAMTMRDPSDFELYFLGSLEGAKPEPEEFEAPMGMDEEQTIARRRARWRSEPEKLSLHGPWGFESSGEDGEVKLVENRK